MSRTLEFLPGLVCIGMAIAVAVLAGYLFALRSRPAPLSHYGELNLRIWASATNLELAHVQVINRLDGLTSFRFVGEDESGHRRGGWVTTDDRALDAQSQRVSVVWERPVLSAPQPAPRSYRDDPLWDDGLDGLPRA